MRAVVAEDSREVLAGSPRIAELIAAIEALDSTNEGCLLDASAPSGGNLEQTLLSVTVGAENDKNKTIMVSLANLDTAAIQQICEFVMHYRNA
jgi:hypothetical protein